MTSRSRHVPPRHGSGKLTWVPYVTSPFPPPRSSEGGTSTGVASFADATSVRTPVTFFHHAVFFDPPGHDTSNDQLEMTPDFPACWSRIDISEPITFSSRMTSGWMFGSRGSA